MNRIDSLAALIKLGVRIDPNRIAELLTMPAVDDSAVDYLAKPGTLERDPKAASDTSTLAALRRAAKAAIESNKTIDDATFAAHIIDGIAYIERDGQPAVMMNAADFEQLTAGIVVDMLRDEQTAALDGSGTPCNECETPASHVCPDCRRASCNAHVVLMPSGDAVYCPGCREVKP
jgi:hypothetical protein